MLFLTARVKRDFLESCGQITHGSLRLRTPEGEVTGAVFGVENIANPENGVNRQHVTLLTGSGFKTIERSQILSVDFLDPDLAEEVRDALTALAKHRDEDQATLEIAFDGRGEREALATYVHSAPVWKASYRLVMPEDSGEPLLQAWAIVENQTDQDWEDVSLTVAAGQPVSFTMDLQTPFTPYRPSVAPPYAVSMAPQVFERELKARQSVALNDRAPASSREMRRDLDTAGARLEEAEAEDAARRAEGELGDAISARAASRPNLTLVEGVV